MQSLGKDQDDSWETQKRHGDIVVGCFGDLDHNYNPFNPFTKAWFLQFSFCSVVRQSQLATFAVLHRTFYDTGPFFLCVEKRTMLCSYFIGCCILDIEIRHGGRTWLLRMCLDLICRAQQHLTFFLVQPTQSRNSNCRTSKYIAVSQELTTVVWWHAYYSPINPRHPQVTRF